jgi:hypothetical protein
MATILQLRRGTTVQHSSFTGAVGEVTVDTTKDTIVVHDGTTAGGFALAKESAISGFITLSDISGGTGLDYNSSTGVFDIDSTVATKTYVDTAVAGKDNTDEITEGSTNLYFTNARARGAVSVTDSGGDGSLAYNSSTGVITYTGPSATDVRAHFSAGTGITITNGAIATTITQYTDALARGAVSVTDSGGDGSLSYNSTTGVITYTGPSATEVRAHFSAGTGVTITNGQVAIGQAVGTSSNVTFNDVTVSGNLTVSGTTTTVNTETINLADNIITLNSNEAGAPSQNAGIEVERGTSTNVAFQWNETNDVWEYTVDGTNYIPVVGTTATQTLTNKTISGSSNTLSNIANSSLTNSKVTIGSTDVSLGATVTTFAGLTSVTSTSFVGALTGNADTATSAGKWTTARTITLGGDLTGSVSIDGSAGVTLTATIAADSVALGTDTTGNYVADVTAGNYILKTGTAGEGWSPSLAVDATSANTASKVVARDASGNFSAGTITATLSGNASTVTNGVYTTDTGTVTNTMLAGSIANAKLVNSSITLAGTAVSLGGAFTAQNMLDAIKTVDGSGSGLDADLLDGQSSAYFRINIYDSAGTLLN